jgi:NADH-quinone oxidoreductase subunit E
MSFEIPARLEAEIDQLIGHYPQRRSAVLMVLHALQDHFGFISDEAMEWTASKLQVQPISIYEVVTFYPMFRRKPIGRYHLKVCRTLSCALANSHQLQAHLCRKLGLDAAAHGPQTTADGKFTVEFVECLANCGNGPVMMCNDATHERVSPEKADEILAQCQ